ncbi:two-component system activity regulator YycH [Lysinibacillus irui]|uniref:Two-component system activity regulator YycH n=1 Tax=Lysinibacillus irui TaxID=2998077 RepID=A0ABU5NRU0_9BACI|nr:two-component system activity regulator YycH [Lysinibacillus irui]MEA0554673.1 two-component system activity regulator YycH [Lysinibacillus irui]MEA0978753.1 two-component system activity regulator YycH [Lysinibacillus irui]MEA1044907.1 two-component system activity regulator YycH [Lysinibacillus irui]
MKYIEPVKSVVLFLLVMLSVVLTFLIWTYTPDYKYIEKTELEEILIKPQKDMEDVIRPYKAIFRSDEEFKGTVSNAAMKDIMKVFKGWNVLDLVPVNNNLSANYVNQIIGTNNRMTIFFTGEIPFSAFNTIFQFTDKELPETTFNRMIIDWSNYNSKDLMIYYISGNNQSLFRSHVSVPNMNQFIQEVIEPAKKYGTFKEIERESQTSLYVDNNKTESVKFTYYIEEISPELFKNVLFTDPNIVRRNIESASSEKYTDGMSLMTLDTNLKSLNYVYPAAESGIRIEPSKLLKDSFEFINEHGGFTADFRYASTSTNKNQMDYQLYLQGLPVYSNHVITRMTTIWGDSRIFHYKRPYFSLDMDIEAEKEIKELPSGVNIAERLKNANNIALADIDEIVLGYYLTQNQELNIFTFEPCWFVIRNGSWIKLTPEVLGGVKNGLE